MGTIAIQNFAGLNRSIDATQLDVSQSPEMVNVITDTGSARNRYGQTRFCPLDIDTAPRALFEFIDQTAGPMWIAAAGRKLLEFVPAQTSTPIIPTELGTDAIDGTNKVRACQFRNYGSNREYFVDGAHGVQYWEPGAYNTLTPPALTMTEVAYGGTSATGTLFTGARTYQFAYCWLYGDLKSALSAPQSIIDNTHLATQSIYFEMSPLVETWPDNVTGYEVYVSGLGIGDGTSYYQCWATLPALPPYHLVVKYWYTQTAPVPYTGPDSALTSLITLVDQETPIVTPTMTGSYLTDTVTGFIGGQVYSFAYTFSFYVNGVLEESPMSPVTQSQALGSETDNIFFTFTDLSYITPAGALLQWYALGPNIGYGSQWIQVTPQTITSTDFGDKIGFVVPSVLIIYDPYINVPPVGCTYLFEWRNRMIYLRGNIAYFSNVSDPTRTPLQTLADMSTTYGFYLEVGSAGDLVTGFTLQEVPYFLKKRGMWLVLGYDATTIQEPAEHDSDVGCISAESLVKIPSFGAVWLDLNHVWSFDGQSKPTAILDHYLLDQFTTAQKGNAFGVYDFDQSMYVLTFPAVNPVVTLSASFVIYPTGSVTFAITSAIGVIVGSTIKLYYHALTATLTVTHVSGTSISATVSDPVGIASEGNTIDEPGAMLTLLSDCGAQALFYHVKTGQWSQHASLPGSCALYSIYAPTPGSYALDTNLPEVAGDEISYVYQLHVGTTIDTGLAVAQPLAISWKSKVFLALPNLAQVQTVTVLPSFTNTQQQLTVQQNGCGGVLVRQQLTLDGNLFQWKFMPGQGGVPQYQIEISGDVFTPMEIVALLLSVNDTPGGR